jgi:MFS family permease
VFRVNENVLIRVAPFGMDLVFSIFYLAAPLILIELGANPVELGLAGTITSSVHMGMSNLIGPLSDRLGRRGLIITAPVIFATSCFLMTFVGRVEIVLALSAINGLCLSLFWPPFQAWIADLQTGSALARDIGSFNMSWTAAHLVGPVLSGFVYSLHQRLPFLIAGAISLLIFFLTRASVQDKKPQPRESPKAVEAQGSNRRMGFLYMTWVANFASWFIIGNARYQFPKLARELSIPPYIIGLLMGCIGLSQFLGFLILRMSDRWHFRKLHLFGAQILAAGGLLLIFFSSGEFLFGPALILIGLCNSVTYYSSLYYAVHLIQRKGRGTGIHESVVGSGALLGPILGGIAAQYAGLRAPYLLCLVLLSVAVAAELNLTRRGKES